MDERKERSDEEFLYEQPVVEEPGEEFGDVLREIQSASGKRLTWQQMQSYTEIPRSTLKNLVNKQLRPTRSVQFIERIRRLPGVTDEHVERLLRAADAPNLLAVVSHHLREGDEKEHRVEIVADYGVNVLLGVRLDLSQFSEAELDGLTGHIKRQVEVTTQMFRDFRKPGENRPDKTYTDFLKE